MNYLQTTLYYCIWNHSSFLPAQFLAEFKNSAPENGTERNSKEEKKETQARGPWNIEDGTLGLITSLLPLLLLYNIFDKTNNEKVK